jgi:hypothetical protein
MVVLTGLWIAPFEGVVVSRPGLSVRRTGNTDRENDGQNDPKRDANFFAATKLLIAQAATISFAGTKGAFARMGSRLAAARNPIRFLASEDNFGLCCVTLYDSNRKDGLGPCS